MTLREIVYMIMDELKLMSDDSSFNEDHIRFLINKYRAYLLNQTYSKDTVGNIPNSNYQTISIEIDKEFKTDSDLYLSSKDYYVVGSTNIPNILNISKTKITPSDSRFGYLISIISPDRMKFVGYNKWMKNIIYCTIEDNQLFLYSYNSDVNLSTINVKGIFENPEEVSTTDIFDEEYPLENNLVPLLIQSVVQELLPKTAQPEDSYNNASDDKANLARYLYNNTKSDLAKQLS